MRLHIPGSVSWDLDIQGNAAILDIQGSAIFSPYLLISLAALGCSTETHSGGF